MKTVLLLSILGLALVCAELRTEDQHTEDADVVAVDDSADSRRFFGFSGGNYAKAKFTASNFKGAVSVRQEKGSVKWSVFLSSVKYDELCSDGGTDFFWHIHEKWTSAATEAYGADCGSANTGGHYDPTYGCGGASQHQGTGACSALGRGKAEGNAQTCSGADLETPEGRALCEYGDQSSKLGKLTVNGHHVYTNWNQRNDPHMDSVSNIKGLSIVLHCGVDKARAACAKFN
jgi:hypothetical protein